MLINFFPSNIIRTQQQHHHQFNTTKKTSIFSLHLLPNYFHWNDCAQVCWHCIFSQRYAHTIVNTYTVDGVPLCVNTHTRTYLHCRSCISTSNNVGMNVLWSPVGCCKMKTVHRIQQMLAAEEKHTDTIPFFFFFFYSIHSGISLVFFFHYLFNCRPDKVHIYLNAWLIGAEKGDKTKKRKWSSLCAAAGVGETNSECECVLHPPYILRIVYIAYLMNIFCFGILSILFLRWLVVFSFCRRTYTHNAYIWHWLGRGHQVQVQMEIVLLWLAVASATHFLFSFFFVGREEWNSWIQN